MVTYQMKAKPALHIQTAMQQDVERTSPWTKCSDENIPDICYRQTAQRRGKLHFGSHLRRTSVNPWHSLTPLAGDTKFRKIMVGTHERNQPMLPSSSIFPDPWVMLRMLIWENYTTTLYLTQDSCRVPLLANQSPQASPRKWPSLPPRK
jgi:hypothetical protein